MQSVQPDAEVAAKKAVRTLRDLREEAAKSLDLARFERKLDILEQRTLAPKLG